MSSILTDMVVTWMFDFPFLVGDLPFPLALLLAVGTLIGTYQASLPPLGSCFSSGLISLFLSTPWPALPSLLPQHWEPSRPGVPAGRDSFLMLHLTAGVSF